MTCNANAIADGTGEEQGEVFLCDDGLDLDVTHIIFERNSSILIGTIPRPRLLLGMLNGDVFDGIGYNAYGTSNAFGDFAICSIAGGGYHGVHAVWIDIPDLDHEHACGILEEGRNEALAEDPKATDLEIARKLATTYQAAVSEGYLMPDLILHD